MRRYRVAWKIPRGLFQDPAPGRWFSRNEARDLAWRFMEMGAEISLPVWVTITFTEASSPDTQQYSADYGDHDIQDAIEREAKKKEGESA